VNCDELRLLLHGYLDGELDVAHHLEVERHLDACPACAGALKEQQALQQALHGAALYHRAPAGLDQRIRSSLPRARATQIDLGLRSGGGLRIAASLVAALLLIAVLAWGVVRVRAVPSQQDLLAQQVVSSHVRSLLAREPVDRPTSDTHAIKPWLSGRLGFSPVVKDLAERDFRLLGGRLDYVNDREVAALAYERRQHLINVFIWPAAPNAEEAPRVLARQGYHLVSWTREGLTYWVISDLNEQELLEFVELLRQ
jgi:anti-sigma factor RsiW